jgi:hypothetical protein
VQLNIILAVIDFQLNIWFYYFAEEASEVSAAILPTA